MKTKVNGKEVSDSRELDSMKKINSVELATERTSPELTSDELKAAFNKKFTFAPGFIPSLIEDMESMNATEAGLSFENCGVLLGYDLFITARSPKYKKTLRRKLKDLLTKLKIIE